MGDLRGGGPVNFLHRKGGGGGGGDLKCFQIAEVKT